MGLWSKVKKAAKKVVNTVKKVVRIVKEVVHRVIKILDFVAAWLGLLPRKHVRLHVQILLDLKGRPVVDPLTVQTWVDQAARTLDRRCRITLHPANRYLGYVQVMSQPAPAEAMFTSCSVGEAFSGANDFFEDHANYPIFSQMQGLGDLLGYGEPIYAFVVSTIKNGEDAKNGCAFPLLTNYLTVEKRPRPTTIVHEMGHLCGLFFPNGGHTSRAKNLMNSDRGDLDDELTRTQVALVRTSRYVTYLRG